jgi:hypothetical protein
VTKKNTEVQEFRSSEVQEFRSSEVQKFRSSEVQKFRSSEVQKFRSSEVQNSSEILPVSTLHSLPNLNCLILTATSKCLPIRTNRQGINPLFMFS